MNINETQLRTSEQIGQLLTATAEVTFTAHGCDVERYAHISRVLKRFDYPRCRKRYRGVLLRYLQHTSSHSRAQLTWLVKQWHINQFGQHPVDQALQTPSAPFARKYIALDIALLVEMEKAHEDVCGPAITRLLKRAFSTYGDMRYERLAKLSSSQLYNLRKSAGYQRLRVSFTKTHPVCNSTVCASRRAPMDALALCALTACIRATKTG